MCYGLSVVAHAGLALACAVTPFKAPPAAPRGGAVVLQVSEGSAVSMPFMPPPPGASEHGDPERDAETPPVEAVLPDALPEPEAEMAQGPPTEPDDTPPNAPDPTEAAEPEPTQPVAAEPPPAEAVAEAPPVHEVSEPGEASAQLPVERDAWQPVSPAWARPDAAGEAGRSADAQAHSPETPPTRTTAGEPGEDGPPAASAALDPASAQADSAQETEPDLEDPPTEADTSPAPPAPAQDDAASRQVFGEDEVDQPIRFDELVRPTPSAISRRHNETGTVVVLIQVNADGELSEVRVLDDAGHPRLVEAALRALRRSSFLPAIRDGHPVTSTRRIEYRF